MILSTVSYSLSLCIVHECTVLVISHALLVDPAIPLEFGTEGSLKPVSWSWNLGLYIVLIQSWCLFLCILLSLLYSVFSPCFLLYISAFLLNDFFLHVIIFFSISDLSYFLCISSPNSLFLFLCFLFFFTCCITLLPVLHMYLLAVRKWETELRW